MSPDAENSNCTVTLDNGDGYYSTLFARPPIGDQIVVSDAQEEVFSGAIVSVELSATCILSLEA